MIRALVITHGGIGQELVRVTEMILGPVPGLASMSNSGKSAVDITEQIKQWQADVPELDGGDPSSVEGTLILIDDYGGSCSTSAQLAFGQDPGIAIISGVNLAMLLGFVTWRDSGDFEELVAKVVQKGREAIILVGGR